MAVILTIFLAVLTSILQVVFLSHLFFPFSLLIVPVVIVSYAVFTERPLTAAIWALFSGLTLDLHGLSGFGTQTTLLLIMGAALWFAFRRVITNTSLSAVFLLTVIGIAVHTAGLFIIDGVRLLFGGAPLMLPFDRGILRLILGLMIVNGVAAVGLFWTARALRRRFERNFITAS